MSEREPYPSEKQERFIVRLPDGMRDRIRLAADANKRSMNAEIVATLEEKYPSLGRIDQVAVILHDFIKEVENSKGERDVAEDDAKFSQLFADLLSSLREYSAKIEAENKSPPVRGKRIINLDD